MYAGHNEGLGEGNYPLSSAPLPHPFCTCLWFVDTNKTLDQVADDLHRWENGESNFALEKAFGQRTFDKGVEKYSKTGIMNWDSAEFPNADKADIHFGRHFDEFDPPLSMNEYIEKARRLLNEADSDDIDFSIVPMAVTKSIRCLEMNLLSGIRTEQSRRFSVPSRKKSIGGMSMSGIYRILCPCCGKMELDDFDICELCGWQNDHTETPGRERSGANKMSIEEAREAYRNGQPVE